MEGVTGEERVVKKRRRSEKEEQMAIGRIHLRSKAGRRRRKELKIFIFRFFSSSFFSISESQLSLE